MRQIGTLPLHVTGLLLMLAASSASAAETIEAIGGERCGPLSKPYAVEFLAPEAADLQASARVMVGGSEDVKASPPSLTLDGSPCSNGQCTFHATKGQSYKLSATSPGRKSDQLCISITRP